MSRRGALMVAAAFVTAAVLGVFGLTVTPARAAGTHRVAPAASAARSAAVAAGALTPGPGTSPVTLPSGPGTAAPGVTAPTRLSARAKVAAVLGGLLLIGVLWAFSQGYGILGGRPRRRPARPAPEEMP